MNIEDHLSQFLARHPDGRLRVGFSGGRDSTVLLAALARLPQARARDLLAVHVNHGLHAEAAQWAAHALAIAGQLGVRCEVDRVQVLERTEVGLEAKARAARREAYSHHLDPGDWMLLAHHQRDQAETVMLRLLAGAGPRGLAAMAEVSELPPGRIGRPLLQATDAQMQASIEAAELPWVEDPANADHQHERSWLRASIMPPLRQRKPSIDQHLARLADWQRELSAGLSRQAAALLIERRDANGSLRLENWAALPEPLRFELLCAWLASHGQPRAGRVLFERFEIELVAARGDAEPSLQCHGGWLRRYRQHAFWMSADGSGAQRPEPGAPLPAYGRLGAPLVVAEHQLLSQSEPGCSAALPTGTAFRIDLRRGGERLRPAHDRPTRGLKTLLQEQGIPPWQRQRLWLLWTGNELAAVLDPDSGSVLLQTPRLQGWRLRIVRR